MKKQSKLGKKLKLSKATLRRLHPAELSDGVRGAGDSVLFCQTNNPSGCPGPICTGQ